MTKRDMFKCVYRIDYLTRCDISCFFLEFAISDNREFAFFVFDRTKHQPCRNLRSYLVLQRRSGT